MKNKVKYPSPPMGKARNVPFESVESQIKFLQGKVLTIVDASYQNDAQRKAVKDLINSAFSQQLTYVMDFCFPEWGIVPREQVEAMGMDVEEIEATAQTIEEVEAEDRARAKSK